MKHLNFIVRSTAVMIILLSEILFAQWNKESINDYMIYDQFAKRYEVSKRDNISNSVNPTNPRSLEKGESGWMPTNGPYGGPISRFARIFEQGQGGVDYIFAGTWAEMSVGNIGGRIFRSQDGENWTALDNFPTYTGSSITSIVSIPNSPNGYILFASSDQGWLGSGIAGVYRSTDYGDTWDPVLIDPFSADISSLAVIGTTLFAGNYWGGVFRSTNFGDNWTLLPVLTNGVNILLVDGTNILAGTNNGVFISTNNGDSWLIRGLASIRIESFAAIDPYIFAGTYNSGIFRSSNYGLEWLPVNNGLAYSNVPSLAVNGTNLYAANGNGGVYLSTNYGDLWTGMNNGLDYTYVGSLFFDNYDANLYAGSSGNGIFRLTSGGTVWSQVNSGLTNTTILSIASKSSGNESLLFAGCRYPCGRGIFRSTNNGGDWVSVTTGLPQLKWIYDLIFKDGILFAGTALNGVFRSTDNGESWISSGLTGNVTCLTFNEEYLFAGGGGVQKSTDNGLSWTSTGLTGVEVNDLAILGDNLFAITGWNGILKSTDNGVSWSTVCPPYYFMLSLAVIGTNIFAGTVYGILRSTDNGVNWTQVNNGLPATDIYEMVVYENNLFAATLFGVYLSTDFGASWSNENDGLENYGVSALGILDGHLYAATVAGSIWSRPLSEMIVPVELISFSASINNGVVELNWITSTETNNKGFEIGRSKDGSFETIGFVEGHGTTTETQAYYFTDKNVATGDYKYRLKQIDFDGTFKYSNVIEVELTSPITFSLEQNYPNPFNPSTTIKYSIPTSEFVTLKVYDVLGNEVTTLVNEEKQEGIFDIKFNATTLPSGTYFYQLKAGSFVETKKMLLLK